MKQRKRNRIIVLTLIISVIIPMMYTYVLVKAQEVQVQAGAKIVKPPNLKGVKYKKSTDKIVWNKVKKPNKDYAIRYQVQFRADYSYGKNKWDKWKFTRNFDDGGKYIGDNWSYLVDTHRAPTQYRVRAVYELYVYQGGASNVYIGSKVGEWSKPVKIVE